MNMLNHDLALALMATANANSPRCSAAGRPDSPGSPPSAPSLPVTAAPACSPGSSRGSGHGFASR